MSENSALVDKFLHHPRHDVATEIFLLTHEAIEWDLEEMQRHLQEPHFTGQPQKVHIFFRWFQGYFSELVKMSHSRSQRLVSSVNAPSAVPLSSPSASTGSGASSEGGKESWSSAASSPWEEQELWEKEMKAAGRMMQDIIAFKSSLLAAQPDDRPNCAEELRQKVEEMSVVLRRCMQTEKQGLVPWVREAVDPEEARAALEGELVGETPVMGWMGLAMWLPWVIHAMERWCTPQDVADFREGLPWLIGNLSAYMWEPLYMSSNWALLQSMADPLEDEDTADYDDNL